VIAKIILKVKLICMTEDESLDEKQIRGFKFENAMKELELIVSQMEDGSADLDKMMKNYQSGMSLIKSCRESIDTAELKLTEISELMDKSSSGA
jgi:exodeoxyribonuclease VII small subunit